MSLTLFAPAKINLWLRVYPPDATGYHPLDTLFCAIHLADEITIDQDAPGIQVDVSGADLGPLRDNLAYRAALEFFAATGITPRARIQLRKGIPTGAGLGGGSSDAAVVLRGLNEHYRGVLPAPDLLALGARLGSDVAFFLCGATLAHATGRGERLRPLPPLASMPMLVVAPDFAVATFEAYRWLDEAGTYSVAHKEPFVAPLAWPDIVRYAHNTFEHVLFHRFPVLARFKSALDESGAMVAMLSGSGSTVFGIYATESERDRAAANLHNSLQAASIISTTTMS